MRSVIEPLMGGDTGVEGETTPPLTVGEHSLQLPPHILMKHQKSTNFTREKHFHLFFDENSSIPFTCK